MTDKETREAHRRHHVRLHTYLEELVADWSAQTDTKPRDATVADLVAWSAEQTREPVEDTSDLSDWETLR